jgi:hypothetical protein
MLPTASTGLQRALVTFNAPQLANGGCAFSVVAGGTQVASGNVTVEDLQVKPFLFRCRSRRQRRKSRLTSLPQVMHALCKTSTAYRPY